MSHYLSQQISLVRSWHSLTHPWLYVFQLRSFISNQMGLIVGRRGWEFELFMQNNRQFLVQNFLIRSDLFDLHLVVPTIAILAMHAKFPNTIHLVSRQYVSSLRHIFGTDRPFCTKTSLQWQHITAVTFFHLHLERGLHHQPAPVKLWRYSNFRHNILSASTVCNWFPPPDKHTCITVRIQFKVLTTLPFFLSLISLFSEHNLEI